MNCSQCEELFAAEVEGLLHEAVTSQLEAHLTECSACRMKLDETRRLFHRLVKDGRGASVLSINTAVMDRIVQSPSSWSKSITPVRMFSTRRPPPTATIHLKRNGRWGLFLGRSSMRSS